MSPLGLAICGSEAFLIAYHFTAGNASSACATMASPISQTRPRPCRPKWSVESSKPKKSVVTIASGFVCQILGVGAPGSRAAFTLSRAGVMAVSALGGRDDALYMAFAQGSFLNCVVQSNLTTGPITTSPKAVVLPMPPPVPVVISTFGLIVWAISATSFFKGVAGPSYARCRPDLNNKTLVAPIVHGKYSPRLW